MQFSQTTCERLCAIEMHMATEALEVTRIAEELKLAEQARNESESAMQSAIRDARSEYGSAWPPGICDRVAGHQADFDNRSKVARDTGRRKKLHQDEFLRLRDLIPEIIKDAREGQNLFDGDTSATSAWRNVQIGDVSTSEAAEVFGGHGIANIGEFMTALDGGRLLQLVADKVIARQMLLLVSRAVKGYLDSRGIDSLAMENEMEAEAQRQIAAYASELPEDVAEVTVTRRRRRKAETEVDGGETEGQEGEAEGAESETEAAESETPAEESETEGEVAETAPAAEA